MNVISSGILAISSGVTSTGLEVVQTGIIQVLNGGWAETVSAADGGAIVVSNGGILYHCTLTEGTATVLNGGWAEAVSVENGGLYLLSSGASTHDTRISSGGSARVGRDVMATGMTILEGGVLHVDPAGYARAPVVSAGGTVHVSAAGIVDKARIYGSVFVSSGGSFNSSTVYSGAEVTVASGGMANSATVNSGGFLIISSGATATKVKENGGYVDVSDGATVSFAPNTFSGLMLSDASATVHSGTVVNGATVNAGGKLEVFSGGTMTGKMTFEGGAVVSTYEDALLDFDISGLTAEAETRINNISIIQGTPIYTLTVSDEQAKGAYTLAEGAAEFNGTLTVQNTLGNKLGTLTVGETLSVGDIDYTLNLTGDTLSVTVDEPPHYDFLINGELLSVRKDFAAGDTFNTITLTTEQLNSFEWTNPEEGISITVNGIVLENGKCEFALAKIGETEKIHVQVTQDGNAREFLINTLNTNLPPITVEGASQTPGDFFLSFFNTRSIIKTDKNGNVVYYRNEDSPETKYGLWDFKAHQVGGKTYYSYHSAYSDPDAFVTTGHNPGERVIMDEHYNEIARITAIATEKNGGETALDGHEFLMLGEDHYIVLSYLQVEADNIPDVNQYTGEPIEHAEKAVLVAAYIQEIDHGEVKFEWLSTDYPELYSMTVTEQVANANDFTNTDPDTYIDYVHLNAIVVDDDGNLVVSCRHLDSMIKIDRNGGTGNLLWALSGLGDDFGLTDEQKTSGQHYLRYLGNGFFSVFNNNNKEGVTKLFLYHLNEDETALSGDDGFAAWIVPGTTEFEPGLPCPPHKTYACGAFQLIGEYGVAGWGWNLSGDELVTEFKLDDASQITFQLRSVYDPSAEYASYRIVKCLSSAPELTFTAEKASWSEVEASSGYMLSIGQMDAGNALQIGVSDTACDIYNLPNGEYSAVVTEKDLGVSSAESSLKIEDNLLPAAVASTANGIGDLFFAKASETWENIYYACHMGSVNDWGGTREKVSANGKNRLADLFFGSDDVNILCLTDDENGDGIFVDDEYTELPGGIEEQQARIARIDEIRAGAGDDIVDMTSNRIEYIGDGLTIRGGDGNDVIWANKGDNLLFGDAGNDRIVGASGDDVIAGGIGNDRMHGGGGNDVFTFCDNWGVDEIEQLATGSVTLWFASGDESKWDKDTMTYTDGASSVTVKGVASVNLKFGDDGSDRYDVLASAGAFAEFTSQKIFEESGKGILASL